MRRIAACLLVLGLVSASSLAAAGPMAPRGAEARLLAPQRAEAPVCGGLGQSAATDFEAKQFPCISLSCLLGGSEGCALACIVSGDISGGFCIGSCCHCVGDLEIE